MDEAQENPCLACGTRQHCCRELENLRLTPAEYERHFQEYEEQLTVRRRGPVYKVYMQSGGACPHWEDGCTVYEERSRECRLFPYTIGAVVIIRKRALVTFHAYDSRCSLVDKLRMPRAEARELVTAFAHEAFGEAYRATVIHEPLILHWAFGMARRLMWRVRQTAS